MCPLLYTNTNITDNYFKECFLVKEVWDCEGFEFIQAYRKLNIKEIYRTEYTKDRGYVTVTIALIPMDNVGQIDERRYYIAENSCTIAFKLQNLIPEKNSLCYRKYPKTGISGEITLKSINMSVIRKNNLTFNDILIIAKNEWCLENGLNYSSKDEAEEIMKKIELISETEEVYLNYLNLINKIDYASQYLSSKHWKHFRKEALQFFKYTCQKCNKTKCKSELNIHHHTYNNKGRETFNDVVVLCKNCHNKLHSKYGKNPTIEQFKDFIIDN